MVKHDALLRIFWPSDITKPNIPGVLVGWRNSASDLLVVSVLEHVEVKAVQTALQTRIFFRDGPFPIDRLIERCGRKHVQVLGLLNPEEKDAAYGNDLLLARTRRGYDSPQILQAEVEVSDVQLIMFRRPHPIQMQYVSLEPISLALSHNSEKLAVQGLLPDELDAAQGRERQRVRHLAEKLQQHTVTKFAMASKEIMLPIIINQINCCFEIDKILQKNILLVTTGPVPIQKSKARLAKFAYNSCTSLRHSLEILFARSLYRFAATLLIYGLLIARAISEMILLIVGFRIGKHKMALKDVSATAQQLDLRLQQFCYWPIQYKTLRERRNNWKSITDNHTEYIRFFNSLWLVANDVILGIAIGSYIVQNASLIAFQLNTFVEAWLTTGLQQIILWLTRNPGGLKLNNELAQFLGNLFQWVIAYWAYGMGTLQPVFPQLIRFIGFTSFGGATMPIALCSDFLSLLTLHIHCFYAASARIYHWQLLTIYSLFHLFRGKKRNTLRNRIDSCDYELDQLLLGTVLFTLLSFLLPTVLVFYSTFAFARSSIIVLKAVLDTMLAALNHFPLFALMLRMKDSRRLPAGVRLQLQDTPSTFTSPHSMSRPVSYISLQSTPLSIMAIFHEYSRFGDRIRKHYLSAGFFASFATGKFVPSMHRQNLYGLQYSMLPARRIGIRELWARLCDTSKMADSAGAKTNGFPRSKLNPKAVGRQQH